ncbi:M13 family metallopeptidase [Novosphingobium sp.]|uniref:M13 family metallopeptidase n=1 Tax=Novosphingobium sp. TaxID=1874826 RepID=UPI003B52AEE0
MTRTWFRRALTCALVALPIAPLMAQNADTHTAPNARDPDAPVYGSLGIDTGNMNRDIVPGDDFFAYMEGNWADHTSIPPDKTRIGYNYDLEDKSAEDVRKIALNAVAHPDSPTAQRIAAVWSAFMNEPAIEAHGVTALQAMIARIAVIKTRGELMALMAEPGFANAIGFSVAPDVKRPDHYAVYAGQGELGLPAREYYLENGEKYVAVRKAYVEYMTQLFALAGVSDGPTRAASILALETALAKDDWAPERMRDPVATYNPVLRAKLATYAPGVAWEAMLNKLGLPKADMVVIRQPSAVRAIGHHLATDPVEVWRDYLVFRLVSDMAPYLSAQFVQSRFNFYGVVLEGVTQQRPRWKRGVDMVDSALGQDVGQIYLKTHWSPEADKQMGELIDDLKASYADKINHAAWMDAPTKTAALAKLATFEARVAGPKTPIDYSDFHASDDAFANAIEMERFGWALQAKRYGGPVDRGLWDMNPQTVNAYYSETTNQITFPAAELQPPFFDPNADPGVNYGGAGATIGHEMGHGFDDQGRQFDGQGRLRAWGTAASTARFKAKAAALTRQFDAYEPIAGVHIKGALTLGENLADLGGLEVAYAAWHRYQDRHGAATELDGMTGDQRFFLSYAQSWQASTRDEALREQLLGDPHSPDKFRVNGIVRNMDEWYAAFDVKPEQKLYLAPELRVHVW